MEEQIRILNCKRDIAKRSLGYIAEFLDDFTEKGQNNGTTQIITAGFKGVNVYPETFADLISEDNTFLQINESGHGGVNIEGGSLIPAMMMNDECLSDDDK
jgi:hypothetical protein